MESHKSAADRIRPILQTMDRTIDSLRRNRTNAVPAPVPTPAASRPVIAPAMIPAAAAPAVVPTTSRTEGPAKLKARPKRLESPFLKPFEQPNYRSQAS